MPIEGRSPANIAEQIGQDGTQYRPLTSSYIRHQNQDDIHDTQETDIGTQHFRRDGATRTECDSDSKSCPQMC